MLTLIVSRTRMGAHRCVGGIAVDGRGRGRSVRLLNPDTVSARGIAEGVEKGSWPASVPFRVGEVWDLDLAPTAHAEPPHVEDVLVRGGARRSTPDPGRVGAWLRASAPRLRPQFCWRGAPAAVFGGALQSSRRTDGTGYVARDAVPATSTGFWFPDRDLVWDGTKYFRYGGGTATGVGRLSYAGEAPAPRALPAGTMVRVSLARWQQIGHYPEACWLQLSGWY